MNIVLIPGILGFRHLGPLSYFNGISDHLLATVPGIKVLSTKTAPLGTIGHRSSLLADQVRAALLTGHLKDGEPICLIAHSMGGLDARHMLHHHVDLRARTHSLAFLGTPHDGTPLASIASGGHQFMGLSQLLSNSFSVLGELRERTAAVDELTPDAMVSFNAAYPAAAGVKYLNVAAVGRGLPWQCSRVFLPTHYLLESLAGPNDGVVPYSSATAGGHRTVEWKADHADLIGHDLDDLARVGHRRSAIQQAYTSLLKDLLA